MNIPLFYIDIYFTKTYTQSGIQLLCNTKDNKSINKIIRFYLIGI